MINDGIYRFFELKHGDAGGIQRKLVGRLWVNGGQLRHLEDHDKLDDLFPEGSSSNFIAKRLTMLQHNPYYEVIHEDDLDAGHHSHHLQQLDLGEVEADQKFIMTGPTLPAPQFVEIWHDAVMLDGRKLDDTEATELLNEVASGRLHLTPLD